MTDPPRCVLHPDGTATHARVEPISPRRTEVKRGRLITTQKFQCFACWTEWEDREDLGVVKRISLQVDLE